MASNKKYWQSVVEIEDASVVDALSKNEFVEEIPTDEFLGDKETLESSSTSRRDFLKYVGFSTAAATLAACEGPVKKSIPYVVKPDDTILGVADWFASSIANGQDYANILVKTREGRPILVMPNKEASGTTNARVQASVLSLYDADLRVKEPQKGGKNIDWATAHSEIGAQLASLRDANEPVILLTGTLASPSTEQIISEFITAYPNVKHVTYDAISESGAADAYEAIYGTRAIPNYHFDKAKTIVSFEADFLGDWHGGFEKGYAASRNPNGDMSYHVQFEANMTLTGANADKRVVTSGAKQIDALINLYNHITGSSITFTKDAAIDAEVKKAADALKSAGAGGVVVTGMNSAEAQSIAYAINIALQSEVFDAANPLHTKQGSDSALAEVIDDIKSKKAKGLIAYNVNPVYNTANGAELAEAIKGLSLSVSITEQNTISATATEYILPAPHYLESWGDVSFTAGHHGLVQPTIQPLFNTLQFQEILLKWSGNSTSYYDYLKAFWAANILEGKSWNQALHDGFFNIDITPEATAGDIDVNASAKQLKSTSRGASGFEVHLYSSIGLGDGSQANNPWLQEFPDPLTRASWDNYLLVSYDDAKELKFKNDVQDNGAINGNYAKVTINGVTLEKVPVMIQPGQANGTVGLALGYGRTNGLKEAMQVGVNAYPFYANGNNVQFGATIEKVAGEHKFACMQVQKTIAGRHDILKQVSLKDFNDTSLDPKHTWNKPSMISYDHKEVEANSIDIWESHNREIGHHFNLSIDLNSCTGCGACVIACHAENNVPVVGKDEMRVGRDMHWLRIDRYYSSEIATREEALLDPEIRGGELFRVLETSAVNPEVTFQPMMCQHCNHAPCETVCPVAATTHGRQGQNMMTYNRCVGTRYCANNCPYRVRRFNWFSYSNNDEFDFNMNNEYGKMVLNPDVVVRSRGVMEKCSMCIQMTQATILKAKREGRKIEAGEFSTACSNACTTGALAFGDVNNEEEEVTKLVEDKRAFGVLDYLQTKPNVIYQVKVRNTNEA